MSHIPAAWDEVKINSLLVDDVNVEAREKRKRRRPAPKNKNAVSDPIKVQAEDESASDKICDFFDSTQEPQKKSKKEVLDAKIVTNTNGESNANIRKSLEQYSSDLPRQPELLEKMIMGMSKAVTSVR